MRKILCLIEDYNELLFLETFLKKIGFDVLSTQKYQKIDDMILGFAPSLFIVSFPFKSGSLESLMEKWRLSISGPFNAPILALSKPTKSTNEQLALDLFDAHITSPIQFKEAIEMIASLLGQDVESLVAKWQSMRQTVNSKQDKSNEILHGKTSKEDVMHVSGGKSERETHKTNSRSERYAQFLKKQPVGQNGSRSQSQAQDQSQNQAQSEGRAQSKTNAQTLSKNQKKTIDAVAMRSKMQKAKDDLKDAPPTEKELEAQAALFVEALMTTNKK